MGGPVGATMLCLIVDVSTKSVYCVVAEGARGIDGRIDGPVDVVTTCDIDRSTFPLIFPEVCTEGFDVTGSLNRSCRHPVDCSSDTRFPQPAL